MTRPDGSAVDDAGDLARDARPDDFEGADFSCGLFHFTRPGV